MSRSTRRFLLPAALVLFVMLISADRLAAPANVKAAFDPSIPAFDALTPFDTTDFPVAVPRPPRILAGSNSHSLPANPVGRNGYCLDANLDNITPIANSLIPSANLGFRVFATDPLDPNAPAQVEVPLPTSGTYVDGLQTGAPAAALNTGVGSTSDDVYCVVVTAPEGYQTLHVEWHYDDGTNTENVIALPDIPIVNVRLHKIGDGLIGGPAEICTVGWDRGFLTGATSNASNATDPDPVDQLVPSDFVLSGTFNGTVEVTNVRQSGPEWCASVGSDMAESGIGVSLNFHAIYNRVDIGTRSRNIDDQPFTIDLPADEAVTILDSVELRHITIDGQVSQKRVSEPQVIRSIHYICLIGTDSTDGDALSAAGIHFQPLNPPDAPTASSINVFSKSGSDPRLDAVQDNTLCFSYTSTEPGEHTIYVNFTNGGVPDLATFDTNNDGNGQVDGPAGPLVTAWNVIDRTVLSTSSFNTGVVTYTTLNVPLTFNLADGTFIGGTGVTEWVLGKHTTNGVEKENQLLDGVLIRAEIVGQCGYFEVPDDSRPTIITGISVGGRLDLNPFTGNPFDPAFGDTDAGADDLSISTLNAGGCSGNQTTRVKVNVYYPGLTSDPAAPEEWVDFHYSFFPNQKVPRVAWAGQYVTITYAISSSESCEGEHLQFVRPKGQPGAFIADEGIELNGPDHARVEFDDSCAATVRYESEVPGFIDVEAFIEGNPYSKIAFPIIYMVFEDLTLDATPDQFVSTFGDVTANVRGYFPSENPSGRPAETKPDGRVVPKDRWILPDDWELLKGQSDLRNAWGGLEMPSSIVTFFMQDEATLNNYKAKVKNGAAGFFVPDSVDDFSFNVNPHTKVAAVLGTIVKPRMMSSITDGAGQASVDTFGDRNLSYEGCAANVITQNPHCKPEDVAGTTRYYAVVEYPEAANRGKWPAVASNVDDTTWRWAGFKEVTILNTDSPQIKYVVAHLRDRDGFCDAANYNNTLGVPVTFEIDAGDGVIIDAADRPFTINGTRRFATSTSFDTTNLLGEPINTDIAKAPFYPDQPDECQAWIKVSNSLLTLTNVTVTFPAPPSPIPGDIRISKVQCTPEELFTVTNYGTNVVNLGGFALKSPRSTDIGNAEELDLIGVLEPGESKTFHGGPDPSVWGWLDPEKFIMSSSSDYVSLVWEDYPISTVNCDGDRIDNSPLVTFPLDGEGEIKLDIVIPFGAEQEVPLAAGWNLVPTGEGEISLEAAFAESMDKVEAIYVWDPELEIWDHYIPGAPTGVNTIDTIKGGMFMWVLVKQPFTLTLPK
ncbi:MAG: hypothetical protein AB7N24_19625 [Dehalococcoidia bacterium]